MRDDRHDFLSRQHVFVPSYRDRGTRSFHWRAYGSIGRGGAQVSTRREAIGYRPREFTVLLLPISSCLLPIAYYLRLLVTNGATAYNPQRRRRHANRNQRDVPGSAERWQRAVSARAARRAGAARSRARVCAAGAVLP